jgi:hypothetical protein
MPAMLSIAQTALTNAISVLCDVYSSARLPHRLNLFLPHIFELLCHDLSTLAKHVLTYVLGLSAMEVETFPVDLNIVLVG